MFLPYLGYLPMIYFFEGLRAVFTTSMFYKSIWSNLSFITCIKASKEVSPWIFFGTLEYSTVLLL